jgi:hypothetical protein
MKPGTPPRECGKIHPVLAGEWVAASVAVPLAGGDPKMVKKPMPGDKPKSKPRVKPTKTNPAVHTRMVFDSFMDAFGTLGG